MAFGKERITQPVWPQSANWICKLVSENIEFFLWRAKVYFPRSCVAKKKSVYISASFLAHNKYQTYFDHDGAETTRNFTHVSELSSIFTAKYSPALYLCCQKDTTIWSRCFLLLAREKVLRCAGHPIFSHNCYDCIGIFHVLICRLSLRTNGVQLSLHTVDFEVVMQRFYQDIYEQPA